MTTGIVDVEATEEEPGGLIPYEAHNLAPEIARTPEEISASLERIYAAVNKFMRDDIDYCTIRDKKSLSQAGAERLMRLFNLGEDTEELKAIETWPNVEDKRGFLYYHYRCRVFLLDSTGQKHYIATGEGTATSQEKKYINQNLADCLHAVRSIARKRAFTAAVRRATGTSEMFTDSLEDMPDSAIDGPPPKPAPKPAASAGDFIIDFGKFKDNPTPLKDVPESWVNFIIGKIDARQEEGAELSNRDKVLKDAIYAYRGVE